MQTPDTDAMPAERTENCDRFERVIIPRVRRAVQAVELIGNGAARNYETTPEEIVGLLAEVQAALEGVESRYAKHLDTPLPPPASSPTPAPVCPLRRPPTATGQTRWRRWA